MFSNCVVRIQVVLFAIIAFLVQFSHQTHNNLLLISIDGFGWNYLYNKELKLPNLERVMKQGVHAKKGMKNVFPTKTYPNHFTLVTGLYPESHGVVCNSFFDPVLDDSFMINVDRTDVWCNGKWYSSEPIWVTNQRQNSRQRSGSYFWPGACAYMAGMMPYISAYPYNESVPLENRIDTILNWFTMENPINFGLLYFEEPDEISHKFGVNDIGALKPTLEGIDRDIGYLLDKLEENNLMHVTNVIILSDHGLTNRGAAPEFEIDLDKYLDSTQYNISSLIPNAFLWPKNEASADAIMKNLSAVEHLTPYKKEDFPKEFHYSNNRRISPIILMADEHYWVSQNNSKGPLGEHGYSNKLPSMHPIFMAIGPSFKSGATVETFDNLDVYPLMCQLLHLEPAPNNGTLDIVKELLKEEKPTGNVTFGTYLALFVFLALVGGIYSVYACKVRRSYKQRHILRNMWPDDFPADETKIGLMSDASEEDEI